MSQQDTGALACSWLLHATCPATRCSGAAVPGCTGTGSGFVDAIDPVRSVRARSSAQQFLVVQASVLSRARPSHLLYGVNGCLPVTFAPQTSYKYVIVKMLSLTVALTWAPNVHECTDFAIKVV